ncbi:4-hydroxy-tetrahydrodipicolinate reductase [uncultured Alphaproteobacteria bacterium]|uniref:4-hydroxy-tetrahydrodipicolinate reductase n=1 Tax=uncultured Alphaproteobacteria bacterium TaxID=91750 RepID=A0A212KAG8_9PROT|nr:4-hydroxy-tetrahydrodipicolinate reductase [uncultured Alphaproteobacteria bacterium]
MKIGIVGCAGRMGRMLLKEVLAAPGCALAGGTEREGSPFLGQDLGVLAGDKPLDRAVSADVAALFAAADAVIDFTAPAASVAHARLAAETGTGLVIGTTGLSAADLAAIADAAKRAAIVQSFNMSLGVNLLANLVEKAAAALGPEAFDIEIFEMHHKHKVDAPSGTAILLGEAAARGRGVELAEVSQRARDGHTGERRTGDIGFAALRGGDVVGDHVVTLAGPGERIELTHRASNRGIYAAGAVRAAQWLQGRKPGLYTMVDVLGL